MPKHRHTAPITWSSEDNLELEVITEQLAQVGHRQVLRSRVGPVQIYWILQISTNLVIQDGKVRIVPEDHELSEAYIETFVVERHARRKGVGRAAYIAWEAALPPNVRRIRLTAHQGSPAFWQKLGFRWRYEVDGPRLEAEQVEMVKGVNRELRREEAIERGKHC